MLAAETARRMTCGGYQARLVEDEEGVVVGVGRRSRRVPAGLARALRARDGGCVFPGCDATLWTEAHHVVHWANGGRTDLGNLVSLCRFHHHRLHEDGFTMRPRSGGGWIFLRPDGRELRTESGLAAASIDLPAACRDVEWDACVSDWDGGGVDSYAASVIIEHLLTAEHPVPEGVHSPSIQP